jgi:hypothetical protein
MTAQWHPVNQFVESLPHEAAAHAFCAESSELVRPELHFEFIDGESGAMPLFQANWKDQAILQS